MAEKSGAAYSAAEMNRPSISLPPRSTVEILFRDGPAEASPGPMTLASSFFEPESEYRSFSQLLAGAMASPPSETAAVEARGVRGREGASLNLGHSRPMNLLVAKSPLFTVPPGLSPGGFLDSPAMFSSNLVEQTALGKKDPLWGLLKWLLFVSVVCERGLSLRSFTSLNFKLIS